MIRDLTTLATDPPDEVPGDAANRQARPVMRRMADVQPEPVRWLWPGRIALGKLTLIAGDPGLGKSFLTLDLAARVSTGAGWPDPPSERIEPAGVVLLSAEDDPADTIRPRLDAAGADPSRVFALTAVDMLDPESGTQRRRCLDLSHDLPAVEQAIIRCTDCRLVVIDPISAYLGRIDSHKNTDVRAALTPLAELAARYGVAIVAVTHLRKGEGAALYRAMGSLAFVAAARAAWAVTRDRDDPTGNRRLFLPVKNNLAPDAGGLAFELRPFGSLAAVAWSAEPVTVTADDALALFKPTDSGAASAIDEAVAWLRVALANGPRPAIELRQEAERDGIKGRTLDRAKKRLGIIPRRDGFGPDGHWVWSLPGHSAPADPIERQPETVALYGELGALCDADGSDDAPSAAEPDGDPAGKTNDGELLEPDADGHDERLDCFKY